MLLLSLKGGHPHPDNGKCRTSENNNTDNVLRKFKYLIWCKTFNPFQCSGNCLWSGCNAAVLPCWWWKDCGVCRLICWSVHTYRRWYLDSYWPHLCVHGPQRVILRILVTPWTPSDQMFTCQKLFGPWCSILQNLWPAYRTFCLYVPVAFLRRQPSVPFSHTSPLLVWL